MATNKTTAQAKYKGHVGNYNKRANTYCDNDERRRKGKLTHGKT